MSTQAVPSRAPRPRTARAAAGGAAQTRLPWWAVVLPALAFAALLAFVAGPGAADASAAEPAARLFTRLAEVLPALPRHLL
ncbi:hypothetical protein ACFWVC_15000 [Streptomyces sp. NPDC058691]|uniref:hypothetical protein n=1 Tax=Streptomyces sp. NPDC058691 TaxID=3346601 RepID=UPI00365F979C